MSACRSRESPSPCVPHPRKAWALGKARRRGSAAKVCPGDSGRLLEHRASTSCSVSSPRELERSYKCGIAHPVADHNGTLPQVQEVREPTEMPC